MNLDVTQLPCPRCGKPQAEWTENDGAGIARGEVTYCSVACAEEDTRPRSLEQGPGRISGAAPSPPDLTGPRTGGLRDSSTTEGPADDTKR